MDNEEQIFDITLIKSQRPTRLALRYSWEWFKWMLCGFEYRPQEEISRIHETRCKPCIYYDEWNDEEGECGICGCPLNKKIAQDNKIAYVSTVCPLPKKQRRW